MKRNLITIVSGLLAAVFTVYIALDTFVITRVYEKVVPPSSSERSVPVNSENLGGESSSDYTSTSDHESTSVGTSGYDDTSVYTPDYNSSTTETSAGEISDETKSVQTTEISADFSSAETAAAEADPVITDTSYSDENIQITLTTCREYDTDIYVADITLSSPEYLKTALAQSSYGKNVVDKTSNIAAENNAILAINGDYYGVQESGYVLRNGVIYRDTAKGDQEDLVIYQDGSVEIVNEQEVSAQELLDNGAFNLLCFGPGLIENGEISVSTTDEVDKATTSNPRTAMGILGDLHYIFVVADGRTSASAGLSLYELAQFMQNLGAENAYNLDGGGSSTMYFNGEVINIPVSGSGKKGRKSGSSSGTSERSVSDIVYIGY